MTVSVLFLEKKDGCLHLCVDYHQLNTVYVDNVYRLPLMKDTLAHLAKGRIFSKLNFREVYYQVRIRKEMNGKQRSTVH